MISKMISKFVNCIDHEFAYQVAHELAYNESMGGQWGFRTAGSSYEHKAADYLVQVMQDIGMTGAEKVPVKLDKWQFNGATLQLKGDTKIISPAVYPFTGTGAEGVTAEIVDVGRGWEEDYEGKDVIGKIVLAGVDLINDGWICYPYNEAYIHGAAALIVYARSGYCGYSDDDINVHEAAADDFIPCVSISKNDGMYLIEQIKNGKHTAVLKVDNEIGVNEGVSYNVIAKIPGISSKKQILLAGHYDKYFYGFQDDSMAVALSLAIAKAMIDSGYQPQNDIVVIAHAAEEWGAVASRYDWAIGSWKMITEAKPEWAEKTIALFNFELPAFQHGESYAQVNCVPEFGRVLKEFIEQSGWYDQLNIPLKDGFDSNYVAADIAEDGIAYRFGGGIPYFCDSPAPNPSFYSGTNGSSDEGENSFQKMVAIYHTVHDNAQTYSRDVFDANIQFYGLLAMYIDSMVAVPIDFCETAELLGSGLNDTYLEHCGIDSGDFHSDLAKIKEYSKNLNEKINQINCSYQQAIADGAADVAEELKIEAARVNEKTRIAFRHVQDTLVYLAGMMGIVIGHEYHQNNIDLLIKIIDACQHKLTRSEDVSDILDLNALLNWYGERKAILFSKKAIEMADHLYFDKSHPSPERLYWGRGKSMPIANTCDAVKKVKEHDFIAAKEAYEKLLEEEYQRLKKCVHKEAAAVRDLIQLLK